MGQPVKRDELSQQEWACPSNQNCSSRDLHVREEPLLANQDLYSMRFFPHVNLPDMPSFT